MHRHTMQQDQRHQQVVEDLVDDLLCHSSSFVSTTAADPPRRRRCQHQTQMASTSRDASCNPFVWGPRGLPAVAPALPTDQISSGASVKRIQVWSAASPTTSKKHDSLRSQSRRKHVSTHEWGRDSPPACTSKCDLPLARSPHLLHVRGVGASRRHSDGEVHHAKDDTREHASSTMRLPVELTRAPSLGKVTSADALIAIFPKRAARALPGGSLGKSVTNVDLAMLKWGHQKNLELASRHRQLLHEKAQLQWRAGEVGDCGAVLPGGWAATG